MIGLEFVLRMTPHVRFGRGAVRDLPEGVRELGGSRVLVVSDRGVQKAGITDRLVEMLESEGLDVFVFSDVVPEPPVYVGDNATQMAKDVGADIIVGVGGGSAMDVAKAVSVLVTNGGKVEDYQGVNKVPSKGLPKIVIPTTAGTGSEVTWTAVFSNPEKKTKGGINSPYLYPDLAILDPELTLSLPPLITASTGLDAFTHAIESFIGKAATPITKMFSLTAMDLIYNNITKAVLSPDDIDARENMLYGSFLAGVALSNAGVGAVHAMAYPLGAVYNIPHGAANSILLPYVMDFNKDVCVDEFRDIAYIMGEKVDMMSRWEVTSAVVNNLHLLKEAIGLDMTLSMLGVEWEKIPELAQAALRVDRPIANNPRLITKDDIIQIYEEAYGVEEDFEDEDFEEV